jgi:hypothetical protein
MAAALGTIILGSVLGCACCLFGVKQYINSMENPTWVDVQYWRNRQARQNGEMDNIHWLQPSVPSTPAPTVQALSTRGSLCSAILISTTKDFYDPASCEFKTWLGEWMKDFCLCVRNGFRLDALDES